MSRGHEGAQLIGRAGNDVGDLRQHLVLDVIALQGAHEFGVELLHDLRRHARRPEQAEPLLHLHVGIARFRHGRNIGDARMPLVSGDRQHAQAAALDMAGGGEIGGKQHVDAAGDRVGHGGGDATIRHVRELCARMLGEQHAEQMTAGADALRAVEQAVRLGLGERDQFRHALGRARGRDDQDIVERNERA